MLNNLMAIITFVKHATSSRKRKQFPVRLSLINLRRHPYSDWHAQRQYGRGGEGRGRGRGFAALTLHVWQNDTFPRSVISFLT